MSIDNQDTKQIENLDTPEEIEDLVSTLVSKHISRYNKEQSLKKKIKSKKEYEKYTRNYMLNKNYGITIEEYDLLLEQQDNKCAICGTNTPGGKGRFHVDHDHTSGAIRGLLCSSCNIGLGHFKDDPEILILAAEYLSRE